MQQLIKDVLATIRSKRSNEENAVKLGLSYEEYLTLKRDVLLIKQMVGDDEEAVYSAYKIFTASEDTSKVEASYNLDKGEARLETILSYEPQSPDEIIAALKIDTKVWKLSQYWNKQKSDKWVVSALVTRIKATDSETIINFLKDWSPKPFTGYKATSKVNTSLENAAAVLSLQDIHFGKEGNEDVVNDFQEAVRDLIDRASSVAYLDEVYYVVGGDLINMDTFSGSTTNGTPVDNAMKATDAYTIAFDAILWSIGYIRQYCNTLHVVYIPGNHDRLSSFHLAHALSMAIKDEHVAWHVEYEERKAFTYGNNFFAFEHGDVNTKNSLLVYATEFAYDWGMTFYRTLYTGHLHTKRRIEYITEDEQTGFMVKILPSLSKTDYWHYHNKYVGNRRAGVIDIHDPNKGLICELVCILD
jgi:hypothetical protein